MNVEQLLGSVLRGVMTGRGRKKKAKGAMRYLVGNPRTVGRGAILLGGLALAAYEALNQREAGAAITGAPQPLAGGMGGPGRTPVTPGPPPLPPPAAATVVPPPLPRPVHGAGETRSGTVSDSVAAQRAPVVPPVWEPPGAEQMAAGGGPRASSPAPAADPADVPPEILRVIRLGISAAGADGVLSAGERDAILTQARAVGAEALIATDLERPRPVRDLLAGVTAPDHQQRLYAIAFAIVRADETVTDGERVYLREVADALGLDAATVQRLEQNAEEQIEKLRT